MIYLQRDGEQAKTNNEQIAHNLEDLGFVRQKSVWKHLIKDFVKTFLAILASALIASWVDPGVDWVTLTVCAGCAIAAYEFFR